jgi:hypothetical protein
MGSLINMWSDAKSWALQSRGRAVHEQLSKTKDFKSLIEQEEDQMMVQNTTYNYSIEDLWMTKHVQTVGNKYTIID